MRTSTIVAILVLPLVACNLDNGTIPLNLPPPTTTTWAGVIISPVLGNDTLVVDLEDRGTGTLTGEFAIGAGRSGTVTGQIVAGFASLRLTQTAPCAASFQLDGEVFNDLSEVGGLWASVECDGRLEEGAFTIVRSDVSAGARASVAGTWAVEFRYGPSLEAGTLDLIQNGALVSGTLRDTVGGVVGQVGGTVTARALHLVTERFIPCNVPRSTAATIANDGLAIDGTWFGPLCPGVIISNGVFRARR